MIKCVSVMNVKLKISAGEVEGLRGRQTFAALFVLAH